MERKAFSINADEWIQIGESYKYEDEKYANRLVGNICIGTETTPGGEQYVTEPFFLDILPLVFSKKATVHLDMYSDPAVVVEINGRMVIHNADIEIIKDAVAEVLNDASNDHHRIATMTELRNNKHCRAKLGRTTKNFRENVTMALPEGILLEGRGLNYYFLDLFLKEFYLQSFSSEEDLAAQMRFMPKSDLVNLYGSIFEYEKTGNVYGQPFKQLLEQGATAEDIKTCLEKEVTKRFYVGDIC